MDASTRLQTVTCPCCGSFMGEAAPIQNVIDSISRRQHRVILELLAKRMKTGVHLDAIVDAMYQHDPNGGPYNAVGNAHTQISILRKVIEPHGWAIINKGSSQQYQGMYYLIPLEVGQ